MTQRTWFTPNRRSATRRRSAGRERRASALLDPSVREELAIIVGRRAPHGS